MTGQPDIRPPFNNQPPDHPLDNNLVVAAENAELNGSPENGSEMVLGTWYSDVYDTELTCLEAKIERAKAHDTAQMQADGQSKRQFTEDSLPLAAATRAEALRRKVLVRIGLSRYGDPPFDHFAQTFLDLSRNEIDVVPDHQVRKELTKVYKPGGSHYKKLVGTPTGVRREALAWGNAKERATTALMGAAVEGVTAEELVSTEAAIRQNAPSPQTSSGAPLATPISHMNTHSQPHRAEGLFRTRGESPLSLQEWCELPLRPVVIPEGSPESGVKGLATFLFDRILYAPQICDRKGRNVGLSPEVREAYIAKVEHAVTHGTPIIASEYVPVVAIGNPIKRNTQRVSLAEVDFFRRLAEISKTVQLYYPPGVHWLIGNEAPAFQGPEFHLPEGQVKQFHSDAEAIVRQIDPEGKILSLFDLSEVLRGTPEKAEQWRAFRDSHSAKLHEAYTDPSHPEHDEVTKYIKTFTYPMATCINPYHFKEADGLGGQEVAEVYAAIKTALGSHIKGVGAMDQNGLHELSPQQQSLLHSLQNWAHDITFRYRTVMDSRTVLPAFNDIIPPHTLAHTIVTKRNKMVLYPNSGRGAYFPAHGEPVLVRGRNQEQRSVVTVRPWWQIANQAGKYRPMYLQNENEPFYFEEAG